MAQTSPEPVRYRCTACGNLTRFDVVESTSTRSFHHYTVGGELTIEDVEVLRHDIAEVSCRWCGNGAAVVQITDGFDATDSPEMDEDRPPEAGAA